MTDLPALYAFAAAALVGIGLYGLLTHPDALRRLVAFNLLGGGVFLAFGVVARRGGGDPVPQAVVITGLVVAFAATTLAVALLLRLREAPGEEDKASPVGPTRPTPGSFSGTRSGPLEPDARKRGSRGGIGGEKEFPPSPPRPGPMA